MCSLRLAWTGEYDGLKRLVSEELKLDGIWEQPGGYKKIQSDGRASLIL
jgi:hypothetical protein